MPAALISSAVLLLSVDRPSAFKKIEAEVKKDWLKIKAKWAKAEKHEVESRAEFARGKQRAMAKEMRPIEKQATARARELAEKKADGLSRRL